MPCQEDGSRLSLSVKTFRFHETFGRARLYTGQNGKTANNHLEGKINMNRMKKIVAALLSVAMAVSFAACAGKNTAKIPADTKKASSLSEQSETGKQTDGGWAFNQGKLSLDQNADVKAAFDKALDGLTGCDYETVAYIGSQVVSGTNCVILCRTTPVYPNAESVFSMVTIHQDLSGNAERTDVTDLGI